MPLKSLNKKFIFAIFMALASLAMFSLWYSWAEKQTNHNSEFIGLHFTRFDGQAANQAYNLTDADLGRLSPAIRQALIKAEVNGTAIAKLSDAEYAAFAQTVHAMEDLHRLVRYNEILYRYVAYTQ